MMPAKPCQDAPARRRHSQLASWMTEAAVLAAAAELQVGGRSALGLAACSAPPEVLGKEVKGLSVSFRALFDRLKALLMCQQSLNRTSVCSQGPPERAARRSVHASTLGFRSLAAARLRYGVASHRTSTHHAVPGQHSDKSSPVL